MCRMRMLLRMLKMYVDRLGSGVRFTASFQIFALRIHLHVQTTQICTSEWRGHTESRQEPSGPLNREEMATKTLLAKKGNQMHQNLTCTPWPGQLSSGISCEV